MDEKSNIKIDNRITPYKKRINTIDDELESEKAKLKKIYTMQENLHDLNRSLNKCIYLLSKSIKGPNTEVVFSDMSDSSRSIIRNATATLEEKTMDIKGNIHKLYEEKEEIIEKNRSEIKKEK